MRSQRFRFEFRMKLASEKPRMFIAREFDDFYELFVRRGAAEYQTAALQRLAISRIEFIRGGVPLVVFFGFRLDSAGEQIFPQAAGQSPQPHRPAELLNF